MDWVKLIIPLIGVAVWIIANLANQKKENGRLPRAPLPPPPPRARPPVPLLVTGDDERKYREEFERKRTKKPAAKVPSIRPRQSRSAIPAARAVLTSAPPPAIQLSSGVVLEPILVKEVPVVESTPPPTKQKLQAARTLFALLKKPEHLAAAFLLKEVLEPPLAKRPRRRI